MSLRHAILGFLSVQPMSGYDLKKAFDASVRHFWPADQTQIYRTLAQLAEEGFAERQVIPREDRLDVKLYHLTEAGREELRRWLSTPLPPREDREPFLIQVFFAGELVDDQVLAVFERELAQSQQILSSFSSLYRSQVDLFRDVQDNRRATFLRLLTLEQGLILYQAHVAWLQSATERVRAGDYTLTDPPVPITSSSIGEA